MFYLPSRSDSDVVKKEMTTHRYIPNSSPEVKKELLETIGLKDSEELFAAIPENLALSRSLGSAICSVGI